MKNISPPSTTIDVSARARIVRAALELFYRHGVRATGVDRVIAEAAVTKVTFYRHFPSKDDLIREYLRQRHETWIQWFKNSLAAAQEAQSAEARQTQPLMPLMQVARKWFADPNFRGCAFANSVAEVGESVQLIADLALQHKHALRDAIAGLLPTEPRTPDIAWAATLALDGAIVNAQFGDSSVEEAFLGLQNLLHGLQVGMAIQLSGIGPPIAKHAKAKRRRSPSAT